MKKVIRLTESDLMRIVKRVINEQTNTVSPKKVKFFDSLANNISSKLINKKLYFGNIGVLGDSSITIKSYDDRNQSINLVNEPVN